MSFKIERERLNRITVYSVGNSERDLDSEQTI